MDLAKTLAQLHADLENLNAAIASLERIQRESGLTRPALSQGARPVKAARPKSEPKRERRRPLSPD
jgi:hypothetical protein